MIKPSQINAPHVSIEPVGNDVVHIHVSAVPGESTGRLLYHREVRCTFVVTRTHVWRQGPAPKARNQPRLPKTPATCDRKRIALINEYLRQAAGDWPFWIV